MANTEEKFMHTPWTPAGASRCVVQLKEIQGWQLAQSRTQVNGVWVEKQPVWTAGAWRDLALRIVERLNRGNANHVALDPLASIGSYLVGRVATPQLTKWIQQWIGAVVGNLREGQTPSVPYEQESPPDRLLMPARIIGASVEESEGKRWVRLKFIILGGRFYGREYAVRFPAPSRSFNRLVFKFGIGDRLLNRTPFWPRAFVGLIGQVAIRKGMAWHVDTDEQQKTQNRKLWKERTDRCCLGLKAVCSKCAVGLSECRLSTEEEPVDRFDQFALPRLVVARAAPASAKAEIKPFVSRNPT